MKTAYGFGTHVLDKSALYQFPYLSSTFWNDYTIWDDHQEEQSQRIALPDPRERSPRTSSTPRTSGVDEVALERSVKPVPVAQYTSRPG